MKLAIMQPYFFPYLGYFQLIDAVDNFVFYDDVSFIKRGWINRNRILVDGVPMYFTVPLENISSNKKINQTMIHKELFPIWRNKFFKALDRNYRKSPYFSNVFELIQNILEDNHKDIASLAINSVIQCSNYMELSCKFKRSSHDFPTTELHGTDRILDICQKSKSTEYVNTPGGKNLYNKQTFEKNNISLTFLNPQLLPYNQSNEEFLPSLSIIDIMMNCNIDKLHNLLKQHSIN